MNPTIDKYVPPKILRTLGDYVRRKQVIEELKGKEVMTIRPFSIVILELKEKLKQLTSYFGEPRYGGKMYETRWVYPFHKKVQWYYKGIMNWEWQGTGEFINRMDLPEFQAAFKSFLSSIYYNNKDPEPEEIKTIIKTSFSRGMFTDARNIQFYNKKFKSTCKLFKIRVVIGSMNYTTPVHQYYHPRNLKRWDKVTKKTSNAGLKADTTYSWCDDYRRGGWTFGGITIADLESLYRVNNGLKPNATKDASGNKITLKYGDYAEWYLHKLV
jgi:hypothetical protein